MCLRPGDCVLGKARVTNSHQKKAGINIKQKGLLDVEQALEKLLANITPLSTEEIPLRDALGRVLAGDIRAQDDIPPFDNSAMDGFAVHAKDTYSANRQNPTVLRVVGDISAGSINLEQLKPGSAMRIMTGAPVPPGADSIVPIELTTNPEALTDKSLQDTVLVTASVQSGAYVRKAGQDVRTGSNVLSRGHRLRSQDIGMLAAVGVPRPSVYRQPKIALFSTGDELIDVSDALRPGLIRDSNTYSLAAAVEAAGAIPIPLGIAADDKEMVSNMLSRSVKADADLIISSAGVSVGAYDFVRSVVQSSGHLEFWRVNIRPGKPILFGAFKDIPFLGLPGNPVSALVTFEIFVRPVIARMSGLPGVTRLNIKARMMHDLQSDGRESYLRARVEWSGEEYKAALVGSQDSGILSSLVKANALIIVPAGVTSLTKGDRVDAWLFATNATI